jgi:shikimate kinase/3-dehydroquinate synthase
MQRLFLTGLPGSGKSTVGRLVARLLGWRFLDSDDLIAERLGLPIDHIFQKHGEAYFRQLESEILAAVTHQEKVVLATGGGAVIAEANRNLMHQAGLIVYLCTSVDVAWQRIQTDLRQSGTTAIRPLLTGEDGKYRLQDLYHARKQWYEEAGLHLTTDDQTPETLALQVAAGAITYGALLSPASPPEEITLDLRQAQSQAIVEWGGLAHLPRFLQASGLRQRAFIVTDTEVGHLYARPIQKVLEKTGIDSHVFVVPAGESSKSLASFQKIIDWLVQARAERQEPMIALGGGVVGDLAGFVAACYQRGVPLIQIPTSLLAQVDAAVGGKTAINHSLGKNLIGAYYQPRLILADPACLLTLPDRVYHEGWAEIIKYGMTLDAKLFGLLETSAAIQPQEKTLLMQVIARCIRLKMNIVQQDEREQGQRAILNYGHTFGHALEAATDYTTWLHGEAVSIGMEVAAQIAIAQGLLSSRDAERQRALLQAYKLPTACPGVDSSAILESMNRDKKVRNGTPRWILPTRIGQAGIYSNVPSSHVQQAIEIVAQRSSRLEPQGNRE